jgi:hypothetical protein
MVNLCSHLNAWVFWLIVIPEEPADNLLWALLLWSAVAERSGDTAFAFSEAPGNSGAAEITLHQSSLAPSLFPPQPISNRPFLFHLAASIFLPEHLTHKPLRNNTICVCQPRPRHGRNLIKSNPNEPPTAEPPS